MSTATPVVVINGIEKFGAGKLASLLVNNSLEVIGVGEYTEELKGVDNFSLVGEISEIGKKAEYYFDFISSKELWKKAEDDGAKLAIIVVNAFIEVPTELRNIRVNWRIVNVHGVYGPKMESQENGGELSFLVEAIKLAVGNKNLILPSRKTVIRLLTEDDLTEVVMRSCFLSGTEREIFNIWGGELNSEELAKVLIDEAKMTRFKVEESDKHTFDTKDQNEVEGEWRKLRWRPKEIWSEAMKETIQAYFVKVDEESRKPKKNVVVDKPVIKEDEKTNSRRFEVMVEDPEIEEKKEVKSLNEILKEEYPEIEEELVEKEEIPEIRPILVKNSNLRLVSGDEPEPPKLLSFEPKKEVVEKSKEEEAPTKVAMLNKKNIDWVRWGWRAMAGFWGIVLLMTVVFVINAMVVFGNVSKIRKLMTDRKYDEAQKTILITKEKIKSQNEEIETWGFNHWVWGRRYREVLKILDQGMVLSDSAVKLSRRSELMGQAVLEDKDIDWAKELSGLKSDLIDGEDALGTMEARLSGDWRWVPGRWRGNLTEINNTLNQTRVLVGLGERLVEVLPEFLGTDGKRREFMVLLQNENELRPTGGFIGSYGILSFEGGKLINFEIKDVYQADGQLKGHVEPPGPIKDYLGEGGWYMRDANWQADFPGAAKDIQWFLDKETGRKVDGVVAINLAVAKAMLGVVGEIYIPDFKEKINKNNLYEQAEFYSETNSFAGSDQKASFLGGLGKQLFESVKGLKGEKKLELAKAMLESLQKNEMLISLNNQKAAATLAELGWNGSVYQGKCMSVNCFADYLYVVEANMGVNKTNYFLYRNIDETIDITNQTISRVVKISYENTAKSTTWPGGDYKNYMRVYIPKTANVAEVSVTDPGNGGQKTVFTGDNLKTNISLGKKEIGFLVTVPVGQKRIVELRYLDQIDLSSKDKFSYVNYVQKQPGFGDTGMVTLISMAGGWQANQVEPAATLVNGKLLFNQKLDRNIKMGVEIGK